MAVNPTTRSSFTSTIWNSPRRATHSTNGAKFGGPNVNISEGSKIQFGDGDLVWDVARIFEDGTLYLTAVSSGQRRTRRVPPSSSSWTNLWIVDGKKVGLNSTEAPKTPRGGGPNRNIDPGNVVIIGRSKIRWTVRSVLRDGTLVMYTAKDGKVTSLNVGPQSKFWRELYVAS